MNAMETVYLALGFGGLTVCLALSNNKTLCSTQEYVLVNVRRLVLYKVII